MTIKKQYKGIKKWAEERNITYKQAEFCLKIVSEIEDIIIINLKKEKICQQEQ